MKFYTSEYTCATVTDSLIIVEGAAIYCRNAESLHPVYFFQILATFKTINTINY